MFGDRKVHVDVMEALYTVSPALKVASRLASRFVPN